MNLTFYVVYVAKHNPADKNYMVQVRVFDGDQHVTDFQRPIEDKDKAMWDARVGKKSAEITMSFPK
jgi:hypothetical protein